MIGFSSYKRVIFLFKITQLNAHSNVDGKFRVHRSFALIVEMATACDIDPEAKVIIACDMEVELQKDIKLELQKDIEVALDTFVEEDMKMMNREFLER